MSREAEPLPASPPSPPRSPEKAADTEDASIDNIKAEMGTLRRRVVMFSLCLALFLSALDITIVATALPTIANHLHANAAEYAWVGSSYTLASTSSTPIWAKLSDVFGRKSVLIVSNALFLAGSLVNALAHSITTLICGRVLQGLGGGGSMILVTIIIGDIFSLKDRAKYYGLTGIVWAVAGGMGPILGGVFTQTIGWRWCFFINLPFDGVSLALLFFALKIDTPHTPLLESLRSLDWIGAATVVGGTICFLYGLESGAGGLHAWNSAFVLCLILFGLLMLALFLVYEAKYAKNPIIPIQVFSSVTNMASLATSCLHSFVFISFDYFLPLYFQVVLGNSPIVSGVSLFALVVPLSALTMGTGAFVRKTGNFLAPIWIGSAIMTVGNGLFIDFGPTTIWWKIIFYQIIAGVGAGPLFQCPLIALQSHVKQQDVAAASSAFTFTRSLFTSISIVIGGVILQKTLGGETLTASAVSGDASAEEKAAAGRRYISALHNMWIFYTAVCGAMILASLFIKGRDLRGSSQDPGVEVVPKDDGDQEKNKKAGERPTYDHTSEV